MITQFRVKNYKALRDVELNLTPIHVLIGPNDTGKTSLLEALVALCLSVDVSLGEAFIGRWDGRELVWNGDGGDNETVHLCAIVDDPRVCYSLEVSFRKRGRTPSPSVERVTWDDEDPLVFPKWQAPASCVRRFAHDASSVDPRYHAKCAMVHDLFTGVRFHRWIPELLSVPVAPYPRERFALELSGFGLASYVDEILGDDRERFDDLEERFRKIFPEVAQIKLRPELGFRRKDGSGATVLFLQPGHGKGLHFKLSNGAVVPASQMSDGALLVLAYLAILKSPDPPRVLLVEEPENGIHPKRLQEVLSILRELVEEQQYTQVLMTTHSPYVLDLFKPEEVTLCVKGDDGAVTTHRLSESKTVRKQIDTFTLGEIWTAEGDEALVERADDAGEAAP